MLRTQKFYFNNILVSKQLCVVMQRSALLVTLEEHFENPDSAVTRFNIPRISLHP